MTHPAICTKHLLIGGMVTVALTVFIALLALLAPASLGSGYAMHIVLTDEACAELHDAITPKGRDPDAQAMPCVFTGYIYPTKTRGFYAVDGLSDNVKGQCLAFDGGLIDLKRSYVDHEYPRHTVMPSSVLSRCHGNFL